MTYCQCPNCAARNSSTAYNCIRCYGPLKDAAPLAESPFTTHKSDDVALIKKIVIVLSLVLLLVVGAATTFFLFRVKAVHNQNAAFETAIRTAPDFIQPVTVEAGRYTYLNHDTHRYDQEATPAAYTLD